MSRLHWIQSGLVLVQDSLRIKPGERVIVVGDSSTSGIAEFLTELATIEGAQAVMCLMAPAKRHSEEPPDAISAALRASDVAILATRFSLTHTSARREASAAGARIAVLPGATSEYFTGGALDIDIFEVAELVRQLGSTLAKAKALRITSTAGTDISVGLSDLPSIDQTGVCHEAGEWGVLPALETAVVPRRGSAEGRWVVDGLVAQLGEMLREPVSVTFRDGRIADIAGGDEADVLSAYLASFNDTGVYELVEIGVGLNPRAVMSRSYLESEAEFGTMHFGVGDGTTFGSPHRAATHTDLVIRDPTLEVDGTEVLSRRVVSIPGMNAKRASDFSNRPQRAKESPK